MKKIIFCRYCNDYIEVQFLGNDFICPRCGEYICEKGGNHEGIKKSFS